MSICPTNSIFRVENQTLLTYLAQSTQVRFYQYSNLSLTSWTNLVTVAFRNCSSKHIAYAIFVTLPHDEQIFFSKKKKYHYTALTD